MHCVEHTMHACTPHVLHIMSLHCDVYPGIAGAHSYQHQIRERIHTRHDCICIDNNSMYQYAELFICGRQDPSICWFTVVCKYGVLDILFTSILDARCPKFSQQGHHGSWKPLWWSNCYHFEHTFIQIMYSIPTIYLTFTTIDHLKHYSQIHSMSWDNSYIQKLQSMVSFDRI